MMVAMADKEAAAWTVAQRLRAPWTIKALSAESGAPIRSIQTWVKAWTERGLVTREGGGTKVKFRVAATPHRPTSTRVQSPERNLWTAMRKLTSFSSKDLAFQASTDTLTVTEAEANQYLRSLLPGGYLRVLRKAVPPHQSAVYRLIRDTGPEAPRERRIAALWDPNEARWTHLPEVPL